jgi:hypothetical protein
LFTADILEYAFYLFKHCEPLFYNPCFIVPALVSTNLYQWCLLFSYTWLFVLLTVFKKIIWVKKESAFFKKKEFILISDGCLEVVNKSWTVSNQVLSLRFLTLPKGCDIGFKTIQRLECVLCFCLCVCVCVLFFYFPFPIAQIVILSHL